MPEALVMDMSTPLTTSLKKMWKVTNLQYISNVKTWRKTTLIAKTSQHHRALTVILFRQHVCSCLLHSKAEYEKLQRYDSARYELLAVAMLNIHREFWHMALCHRAHGSCHFEESRGLHLQGKAIQDGPWRWRSCKMSETHCPSTRYHIPGELNLWQ